METDPLLGDIVGTRIGEWWIKSIIVSHHGFAYGAEGTCHRCQQTRLITHLALKHDALPSCTYCNLHKHRRVTDPMFGPLPWMDRYQLVSEHYHEYQAWMIVREHCCKEWEKFEQFYADTGECPEGGQPRRRGRAEFSPKNFYYHSPTRKTECNTSSTPTQS